MSKTIHTGKHLMPIGEIIAKIQAYKALKEIKSALQHVKLVSEGKIKPETIEDFLNEVQRADKSVTP